MSDSKDSRFRINHCESLILFFDELSMWFSKLLGLLAGQKHCNLATTYLTYETYDKVVEFTKICLMSQIT
jgi:hypothetical protein